MTAAEVRLWGTKIGTVAFDEENGLGSFEYDPGFLPSGIEVAPIAMPLSRRVYTFPELARQSFSMACPVCSPTVCRISSATQSSTPGFGVRAEARSPSTRSNGSAIPATAAWELWNTYRRAAPARQNRRASRSRSWCSLHQTFCDPVRICMS